MKTATLKRGDLETQDDWYSFGYQKCYYSRSLGLIWGFVHFCMEHRYKNRKDLLKVIEVGAGQGQHYKYVRHHFEQYTATDIRNSQDEVLDLGKLTVKFADASDLKFINSGSFDRLIATCLLAHLDKPQEALKEWRRVIRAGGVITIYVPPEPGILVRIVRQVFIWPKARRLGLKNPQLIAYLEHRNHYPMMRSLIHEAFKDDLVKKYRFPIKILPWNLSIFDIYHIELTKGNKK
jgi:phosphatidylethanolamine/phosphatidyl-N-methylethanolamine N-methyltransferase